MTTTIATRPPGEDTGFLERLWSDAPGIPGFLTTVDHKRIGTRYFVTSFLFLLVGGVQALLIRLQLAGPNQDLLDPEAFNQLMTMHGTTMIFLFNTPIMLGGFGNYVTPLQIGARDMAFPRVNALSYWIFLFSGGLMYASFFLGKMPDGGWFAYPPLTGPVFSPGVNLDFWAVGVIFVGLSTTAGAINLIVTIFRLRAPGMSLNRMPLFVWAVLVTSFMSLFAFPAITLAPLLLELDRIFGMTWYWPAAGGSAVLYQHLFWFWGHPEVYILLVPATGIVSTVIPVFARHRIVGYSWMATALVAIGFLSFGVWVHHMFAVGVPFLGALFFAMASLLITIPSGVQFFGWIATVWRGRRPVFSTPMLFSLGFLFIFLLGGFTGVMVAVLPFDLQVHDSYFVVAHFHYVLIGGVVFPVFAGIYYWLPKLTGRMFSERAGKVSFWTMFVGFNVAFFPMHILGLFGMPRRVYTYQEGLGWDGYNLVATLG
ncbi:MAG TPA: cbb3-type cytochrome c oxidase subunit I, partial [Acidimicrobiia bacterium]|nr:cbb3-type cytochrome c oxidase subunit I [Acidimicrobiia bacterium]